MPFNHRRLWSTPFVKELLRQDRVSEAASFHYFLAIMAFDWLQFTLIATTPASGISAWSRVNAWATFVITVAGLIYLYRCNGSAAGRHFLTRYFALSVTVGWKFVAIMLGLSSLLPALWSGHSAAFQGWSTVAAMALINLAMFRRIGGHLAALAADSMAPGSQPTPGQSPAAAG